MTAIKIDVEDYFDLLKDREDFVVKNWGWRKVPDALWDYIKVFLEEAYTEEPAPHPDSLIDNIIVNGDWGSFDDYRRGDENDEEMEERLSEDGAFYIDRENDLVIFSL